MAPGTNTQNSKAGRLLIRKRCTNCNHYSNKEEEHCPRCGHGLIDYRVRLHD